MWFFKKNKGVNKTPSTPVSERKNIPLPLYRALVLVDCFNNRVSQGGAGGVSVGDVGYIVCEDAAAIDTKHKNAVVFINGVDCGFLPSVVGDCICDIYHGAKYPCTVATVLYGESPALSVNIMLPYIYNAKGLPLPVTLASESNTAHQASIKESAGQDYVSIKYNAQADAFEVFNLSIGKPLGRLSDVAADKVRKKHKNATSFFGTITRISATYDRITLTPSILLITIAED